MSVGLSLQYNGGWNAFITHTFRERLMVWTVILYLIGEGLNRGAILAHLVRSMLPFALRFHIRQVVLEALMLCILYFLPTADAVGAFLIWPMFAGTLDELY